MTRKEELFAYYESVKDRAACVTFHAHTLRPAGRYSRARTVFFVRMDSHTLKLLDFEGLHYLYHWDHVKENIIL